MSYLLQSDNVDIVKALIVFGADINAKNSKGETPRHLAATSMEPNQYVLQSINIMIFSKLCKYSYKTSLDCTYLNLNQSIKRALISIRQVLLRIDLSEYISLDFFLNCSLSNTL